MEGDYLPNSPFHATPGKAANIKVAVRLRPPLDQERKSGETFEKLQVGQDEGAVSAWNDRTHAYKTAKFDIALDQDAAQARAFEACGMHNLVRHVVGGYHATVFAYGQTGSGKTYTMEGYKYKVTQEGKAPQAQFECGENEGMVPRSIRLLFDLIKQQSNLQKKKFTVYCSYLQVYKEKIYDLLNKSHVKGAVADGPGLKLKWNKNDVYSVENLYTFECRTVDDVMALYHFGIKNKVVASHNMNNSSSRSHSLLSITVEQVETSNPDNVVVSKLQLVDLAGSERSSQTGNTANKESIDINKSLFTLRQVITALVERQGPKASTSNSYIPYRDSKLTCLLRQSLGGNSYCLMVACLNPCDGQIDENISTLQYASQASYISNKPIRNEDPKAREIQELKDQVRRLTEELAKANKTIDFLTKLTKENQSKLTQNYEANTGQVEGTNLPEIRRSRGGKSGRPDSAGSAVTERMGRQKAAGNASGVRESSRQSRESSLVEHRQIITQRIVKDQEKVDKFFKEKADQLKNIASYQKQQNPHQPHSAANESKDAITERIVHTVNMMKEVLQGNLSLRETIQKQSEQLDDRNAEMFQLSQENEDLRERLAVLEEYSGKDSLAEVRQLVREKKELAGRVKALEETSHNWAAFQRTGEQFNRKKTVQMSRGGATKPSQERQRATLDNEFNDDFEPQRPRMENNQLSPSQGYYDDGPMTGPTHSQLVRNNQSYQRVAYNEISGEKEFRVTTTNMRQKSLNRAKNQAVSQSKSRPNRAPIPHNQMVTDRNRQNYQNPNQINRQSSKVRAGKNINQQYRKAGMAGGDSIPGSQNALLPHTQSGRKLTKQGWDLNNTVDNIPGQNGLEHDRVMRGYAHGGRFDANINARRKTASSNAYSRGPSSTNYQVDNDEPQRPLILQPEQAYSPNIGARGHDAYSDAYPVASPARDGQEMSKTAPQAFQKRLPPRSPSKYAASNQNSIQQRQYNENNARGKQVNTSFPGESGFHGGPLATSGGRTTNSQPDLAAPTGHSGPATSNSGVKKSGQYEEGSEYYDEEQDQEIEADVRQPENAKRK